MNHYFFDTADGDNDTDKEGVDLASDDEAVREGVRYAGMMISHNPALLDAKKEFIVTVRCDEIHELATIRVLLSKP